MTVQLAVAYEGTEPFPDADGGSPTRTFEGAVRAAVTTAIVVVPPRQIDISAAVIRIFERLGWATSVHWPVSARLDSRRRSRGKPEPALQPGGRRTERAAASRRSPLPASGDRIR